MRSKAPIMFIIMLWWGTTGSFVAQSYCDNTYAKILGSLIDNEKGYTLAFWSPEQVLYLGGLKRDSVVILKINVAGEIEWTRTFDFIPGRADHLRGFIVDSDGMIVGSGGPDSPQQGTSVFAFRYNPETNTMLWAHDYRTQFNNLANSIQEMTPGSDYIMSNNPHTTTPNDLELWKINRNTGQIIPAFSKHYHLGGSQSLGDISYHEGYLYATGRFTDGAPNSKMRNTLIKLDPNSGLPEWTLLGHKPQSATARLYGVDHVIDLDTIYSVSLGDPDGTNINSTEVFVQKTTLDGNLVWMNRYDLPGTNDWVDEIISSDNGLVILGHNRVPPSDMILFKIDRKGDLLWSRRFDFSDNDNSVNIGGIQSQLLEFDGHIFFTAHVEKNGLTDMLLVKTNLLGEISDTCFQTSDMDIPNIPVSNPVFYNVQISVFDIIPQAVPLSGNPGQPSSVITTEICRMSDSIHVAIERIICDGEVVEGYTMAGQYIDHFLTQGGCDSIRTLTLMVQSPPITIFEMEICAGDTFEGYSLAGIYIDTFTTATGCDSIRQLQLEVVSEIPFSLQVTICPGQNFDGYLESGTFIDTISSATGCDSIRTLTLLVTLPEKEISINICSGAAYESYTQSGLFIDTLYSMLGECDTLRRLTLTVNPPIRSSLSVNLCEGDFYFGYSSSGIYNDTLSTEEGCDSIRTVALAVIPPSSSIIDASFCDGVRYGYTSPGTYTDTLISHHGCDSIRTVHLEGMARYIPNIFSPNGDQINDIFEVISFPDQAMEVEYFAIFDRFGDMAFQTNTAPIRWDGRDNTGKYFNPGVYAYVLVTECNGKRNVENGDITLLR